LQGGIKRRLPYIKTIGMKRARGIIGLMNLTYNLRRFMYLHESRTVSWPRSHGRWWKYG